MFFVEVAVGSVAFFAGGTPHQKGDGGMARRLGVGPVNFSGTPRNLARTYPL